MNTDGFDELSLAQRLVLLGLADCASAGKTPVNAAELVHTCSAFADHVHGDVLGRLSEAEVDRALNTLAAGGLVEEETEGATSPVGKGRPVYRLGVGVADVVAALGDDDRLTDVAAGIPNED